MDHPIDILRNQITEEPEKEFYSITRTNQETKTEK